MPVPDFQSLMLPVLRAVADGDISAADLRSRVATALRLTEADLAEMLPSGRQTTFANRAAWANIFLQRAGLLEKVSRGVYRITDEGRKALAERPERIDMRFLEGSSGGSAAPALDPANAYQASARRLRIRRRRSRSKPAIRLSRPPCSLTSSSAFARCLPGFSSG